MTDKNISRLLTRKSQVQENGGPVSQGSAFVFPTIVFMAGRDELPTVAGMLHRLPTTLGMSYVVIAILPKEANGGADQDESKYVSALQAATSMRVLAVDDGMRVEPDHIYLIGTRTNVSVENGSWRYVSRIMSSYGDGDPDVLLSTLAGVFMDQMAVVLSMRMARAITVGLRVVQGEGGLTMIAGDENGGLKEPGSFLSDCADIVVEPDGIADRLSGLAGRLVSGGLASLKAGIDGDFLTRIYFMLSERKGVDLFVLKEEDVVRHVFRRMVLTDIRSREEYYEALVSDAGELDLLYEELMGCSTGFSPEPGLVMQLVDRILAAVMESKADQKPLRIWMPGCTCGEEVYAVAFCVVEYLKEKGRSLPVQLFASSLNRTAILKARLGVYDEVAVRKVSAERRRKFFVEREGQYHIVKAVKDICVFAMHNLVKDPPFSHIDLVIGRNMMAGMDKVGQKKVVESLHYALNEGGWLVSGGYRAGGINDYLFRQVSDSPRVYRRLDGRSGFTHAAMVLQDTSGESEASKVLMSGYVPASILIDEGCRVIHFYGNVEPYLRPWEDRPSLHLLKIVRDELVFDIGEMLGSVARDEKQIRREGMLLGDDDKSIGVDVIPLSSPNKKWRLVIIRPMALGESKPAVIRDSRDRRIEALKKELAMTREQLVVAYEQSASAQESLHSAHEEMMASNEELQSINEELQSINQAMERTVGELRSQNIELDSVNKDLHQRNRGLEMSVEHAYAVIAAIRQPLMVLSDDLRIRMVNSCCCQIFGVHADDVKGEYLYVAAGGVWDIEELRKKLQVMAAARQAALEIELKHVFPRLGERVLTFTATRIRDDGKSAGILLAMEDVTTRRMADRVRDEFIGIASHELKTPTTSIMAYSQLLYDELKGASDQRAAMLVDRLNSQVGRLARLTKDLLDVTRISQGQITLKKQYFNLNDLIGETVDDMQVTTPIHIIIGELALAPPIWGDSERIGQVLRNLLSNAIKYSPAAKEVRVYTKTTKKNVHVSVEDHGIGMSTETLQRVFDRFYRSDDPSVNGHPGLGLGLYIASEIIRRHDGTITVKSEKGKGSVFTVILPFGSQE